MKRFVNQSANSEEYEGPGIFARGVFWVWGDDSFESVTSTQPDKNPQPQAVLTSCHSMARDEVSTACGSGWVLTGGLEATKQEIKQPRACARAVKTFDFCSEE